MSSTLTRRTAPHRSPDSPPQPQRVIRSALWSVLGILAIVAALPPMLATEAGLGISPDSTQYLATARSLIAGAGLKTIWWNGHAEPLTHFPPLYPLIIAVVSRVGISPERAAWALQLLLAPLNACMMACLATRMSGGSDAARARVGVLVVGVAVTATDLATAHAMMWSEPLFLLLLMCTLLLLSASERLLRVADYKRARQMLFAAACSAGIATVTRYVGIALIGSCALGILLLSNGSVVARLRRALFFGIVSIAPLLALVAFNHSRSGNSSNREIAFHPITLPSLAGGANTVLHWFSPFMPWTALRLGSLAILTLCAVAMVAILLKHRWHRGRALSNWLSTPAPTADILAPDEYLLGQAVTFGMGYVSFLIVSISLVDYSTMLDSRILLPILVISIVVIPVMLTMAVRWVNQRNTTFSPFRLVLGAFYIALMVSQSAGVYTWTRTARSDGLGLSVIARASPGLLAQLRALPQGSRIYSNMPDFIYFSTNRVVMGLPRRVSPTSLRTNANFESEMKVVLPDSTGSSYVVFFSAGEDLTFVASKADVDSHFQVEPVLVTAGGRIDRVHARNRTPSPVTRVP